MVKVELHIEKILLYGNVRSYIKCTIQSLCEKKGLIIFLMVYRDKYRKRTYGH